MARHSITQGSAWPLDKCRPRVTRWARRKPCRNRPAALAAAVGWSRMPRELAGSKGLQGNGLEITDCEACRNHSAPSGGRVRTDRSFIPGDCVELGGEFIGRNHPTWLAYAQEFNLRLEEPGAAPPAPPEAATTPSTEPATTEPATPSTQPGAVTPKPEHLETEMEPAPVPAPA